MFVGYAKYRTEKFGFEVMDLQLLVSTSFRFIATVPISKEHTPLNKYFQFFFYPASIVGPWITFTSFLDASKENTWSPTVTISTFISNAAKWIVAVFFLELSNSLVYTYAISLDYLMIQQCGYWSLVSFMFVAIYKHMMQLYACNALNYAVMGFDELNYK